MKIDIEDIAGVVSDMSPAPWKQFGRYVEIPGCDSFSRFSHFDDSADALGVVTLRNMASEMIDEIRRLRMELDAMDAKVRLYRGRMEEIHDRSEPGW